MGVEPRSVDIVVATRHPAAGITALLRRIAAGPDAAPPVIVVRSGAPTSALRPGFSPPPGLEVTVVDVPEPGVAIARNVGLVVSEADVVCYLDDDVEPQPGWLASILGPFADPAVGLVGGSVLPRFPAGTPPRWLPAPLLETFYAARDAATTTAPPFGLLMAVRRQAALAVGGCPEGFGHTGAVAAYHEETILGRRIVTAGWVAAEAPGAVVHHLVPDEHSRRRWLMRRAWAMGRSDARRDRLEGDAEPRRRAAKGLVLLAASPVAALVPRLRWYVAARMAVNGGYLREYVSSRASRDGGGPTSPPDRAAGATAPG
jgi:GT2 family glycosyltransferase